MALFSNKHIKGGYQYLSAIAVVLLVGTIAFLLSDAIGYRVVGYILLITVSLLAMDFDIMPVLLAATLSALVWDFFFIPPRFTLFVNSEDTVFLLTYFVIALLNATLTYKLRRMEKQAMLRKGREHTVKLYNTLLNSLSHELRTPIATIVGATDNLRFEAAKLNDQQKAELLDEIAKASFRLNQQVGNLLNMSRLESGFIAPHADWCDINELIYETLKRVEGNQITQRINVEVSPDLPLYKIDYVLLEQALYNIVNNACIYTPPGSAITIKAETEEDDLKITIEDNGPGFPEEEIGDVFNKFYRLRHTKAGGTGLGLSIVKGFTEAMGGSVRLQNRQGGGARFIIKLPAESSFLKNMKNE